MAAVLITAVIHLGLPCIFTPVSRKTPTKHARNEEIRRRYAAGKPREYGISYQRVSQIVGKH